jgi:hypothetical protein
MIPEWLQLEGEPDGVDWEIIARYAAQKSRMVPALAKTLRLRFEDRTGRPAAVAAAKNTQAARDIENAWKWIDRNWRDRMAPLFQLQKPPSKTPKPSARPNRGGGFIPPAEALSRAIRGPRPGHALTHIGPSIQNHDRLRHALEEIGLPPDVRVGWNNCQLFVTRGWSGFGIQIDADTLEEALEILRELVTTGEIDVRKADFLPDQSMQNE